jgi:hypothetical protein
MKSKFHIRSLLLGVALGTVLTFVVAATTAPSISWEYSVVTEKSPLVPSHADYDRLRLRNINQLSKEKEGWEIVCEYMIPYEENNHSDNHVEAHYARETVLRRVKK